MLTSDEGCKYLKTANLPIDTLQTCDARRFVVTTRLGGNIPKENLIISIIKFMLVERSLEIRPHFTFSI